MTAKTPEEVARIVGGTGHMTPERGRRIMEFVRQHRLRSTLELGFAHGVSTCYLAAAVCGDGGQVVSIDRESAREKTPNAEELLTQCGWRESVTLYHELHDPPNTS